MQCWKCDVDEAGMTGQMRAAMVEKNLDGVVDAFRSFEAPKYLRRNFGRLELGADLPISGIDKVNETSHPQT